MADDDDFDDEPLDFEGKKPSEAILELCRSFGKELDSRVSSFFRSVLEHPEGGKPVAIYWSMVILSQHLGHMEGMAAGAIGENTPRLYRDALVIRERLTGFARAEQLQLVTPEFIERVKTELETRVIEYSLLVDSQDEGQGGNLH